MYISPIQTKEKKSASENKKDVNIYRKKAEISSIPPLIPLKLRKKVLEKLKFFKGKGKEFVHKI